MKKQYGSLLIVWMLAIVPVMAQEITWGPEQSQNTRNTVERIIGEDNNGIYVLRYKFKLLGGVTPVVEHYNKQMVLTYATPLKSLASRNISINNFWQFNNKLYIYFSKYNGFKSKQELFFQEVDKKTGLLAGAAERIASVASLARTDIGTLQYAAATDSSRAVIFSSSNLGGGLFQRSKPATFTLHVVDKDFKLIWNKYITVPYDEDLFSVEKVEVDRQGNAYVLARVYKTRKERESGEANYFYKVLAYEAEGEKTTTYDLDLKDKTITDITFKVNRKNQLTCAGFYSERRNSNSMKGTCFFTIDTEAKTVITEKIQAFEEAFLAKLMSNRQARKGRELYKYYLDEIILRSDGGAVLIAEQYYVVTQTYYSGVGVNRVQNVSYTYHYEDIIILNINPDGSMAWATNVPKQQQSSTRAFSSYAQMIVKGKIHFIYNDYISRRAPVMHATVNTAGEVSISELFNNKEEGILTKPPLCKQTSKNEMVIYGERGKRFKFGKIDFSE